MRFLQSFSPHSRGLLARALAIQALLLMLAALNLDMGVMWKAFLFAAAAFWIGAGLIMIRRGHALTKADTHFLRWGLPVLSLLTYLVVMVAVG